MPNPPSLDIRRWSLALAAGLGVVALAVLPPFVPEGARVYLMQAFSAVCHQLPDRSPALAGVPLAVCHRCLGIYAGLPIAAVTYLAVRHRITGFGKAKAPYILGVSLLPMVLDWGADVAGFYTNTAGTRVATGLIFGITAGMFFVVSIVEMKRPAKSPADTP